MPNVVQMEDRMKSHLARVSGKALEREIERIWALRAQDRISGFTLNSLISTAAIRLAYKANAA